MFAPNLRNHCDISLSSVKILKVVQIKLYALILLHIESKNNEVAQKK